VILTDLKCSLLLVVQNKWQNTVRKFLSMNKNTWILPDYLSFINRLTPELNPYPQRCMVRFFTGDFAS
jgi:hypothetical protein